MGAEIERTDPDTIEVDGKRRLRGAEHRVIPDRHRSRHVRHRRGRDRRPDHADRRALRSPRRLPRRRRAKAGVDVACGTDTIEVDGSALGDPGFRAVDIETGAYPGLATDLQPPTSVLLSQARGASRVHETIFEDRLDWMSELRRMGAQVDIVDPHHAVITGRAPLHGAEVEIGDLRAGASLILAALAADGETDDPRCSPRSPGL